MADWGKNEVNVQSADEYRTELPSAGEEIRIRVIAPGFDEQAVHWVPDPENPQSDKNVPVPCLGEETCSKIKTGDGRVLHRSFPAKWRYRFPVYNYTTGKTEYIETGPGITGDIEKMSQDEDLGDPRQYDLKIVGEPNKKYGVQYDVRLTADGKSPLADDLKKKIKREYAELKEAGVLTFPESDRAYVEERLGVSSGGGDDESFDADEDEDPFDEDGETDVFDPLA